MKSKQKYLVIMIGGIVILAGLLFAPITSAHEIDTADNPMEHTEHPHNEEHTYDEHTEHPHNEEHTYRSGCHGEGYSNGPHHNGYDTHQDTGWFGGHGMIPWFGW